MGTVFKPELLTDKSRLQEIYDLRVAAYEKSPKSVYVNRQTFPAGLYDNLDNRDETVHWIIQHADKIIASARLAIITDLQEIKDITDELDKHNIPKERPFAYYSRLVVHPDYRKLGLVYLLDKIRIDYLRQYQNIKFAIGWATLDRKEALVSLGFSALDTFDYTWGGTFSQPQCMFILYCGKGQSGT